MSIANYVVAAGLSLSLAGGAAAQTVVVTQPYLNFSDTIQTDIVIREVRDGARVVSARADLCFQDIPEGKSDRVVIDLKANGQVLSGIATSQVGKVPVEFSYAYKHQGNDLSYSGIAKIGPQGTSFEAERVAQYTEKHYEETLYSLPLVEKPADFTLVSPQWVAVRAKLGTVPQLIERLRSENVMLDSLNGLIEDCAALRSGVQTIQFIVQPERAEAVMAAARSVDGVLAAGWGGVSNISFAVRIPAAGWTVGGKLDRGKLASALSHSIAQATGATVLSSDWNVTTGDLMLRLKRKSRKFEHLGFTETLKARALAEFERPGASDHFIVWIGNIGGQLSDEGPGPRLQIQPLEEIGGEGIYVDPEPIVKAIARDLKGVTWDPVNEKWN